MTRQPFGYSYKSDAIFRPDEPSAGGAVSMHGQGKPNKSREGKVTLQIIRNGNKIYFKRIPERENEEVDFTMMNNNDMVKKMVKEMGLTALFDLATEMESEIKKEEQSYKTIIPTSRYGSNGKQVEFPDWVTETVHRVVSEIGTSITHRGDGDACSLTVTNECFAKYIVYTCNDEGKTLRNVLEILLSAPAWSTGHGMTRARMELVFHILVLHKGYTETVVREMKSFLQKYDPTALKVFANADEAFRHTLNHEIQMIAYTERHICNLLNEEAKFEYKIA